MNDYIENILDSADPDTHHFGENPIDFCSYTVDELHSINMCGTGNLNILHHNCRSILREGKIEEYEFIFDVMNNPFHILGFTETWLKEGNCNGVLFEEYEHVYNLRTVDAIFDMKERGGGVSFFIKNNLNFKVRDDLNRMLPFIETLFIEVQFNKKSYIIGVIYRVPNTNIELFTNELNAIIEPIKNNHELIIMGDFNICLLQDNKHTRSFRNCMQSNSLYPTIIEPTRISSYNRNGQDITTETLIDNIFVNNNAKYKSGTILSSISDHYPVFISIIDNNINLNYEPQEIQYRLIDPNRIKQFKLDLRNSIINYSSISKIHIAKDAFTIFFNIFNELYNTNFPIVTKKISRKSILKPWVSPSLTKKIKIKDNLGRLASKGKIDRETFTRFRNQLTTQLRLAKAKYYETEFLKHEGDIKGTWKIINSSVKKQIKF